MAKGFIPTEFDRTPSTNAQMWQRQLLDKEISLIFEAGLFRTAD